MVTKTKKNEAAVEINLEVNDREKKLALLNKKYKSSLIDKSKEFEVISTGSITLDIATGIGGIPLGKIVELQGPESSGKSTLTLEIIAQAQKIKKECCLVDYEGSFDRKYAIALGINVDKLEVYQPDSLEEGYNLIVAIIEEKLFDLIVLDSHTAATPQKIIEGDIGDHTMGLQARFNSTFLSKIKIPLSKNNITLLAISQTRINIGGYGDPNVTTGGQGWKFYSDMRIKLTRQLDKDKELNKTTATMMKNKCDVPFKKAEFNIVWGKGIDTMQEVIDLGIENNLLHKGGAWYTLEDGSKVQGDEGMKKYLTDNSNFYNKIIKKLDEGRKSKE